MLEFVAGIVVAIAALALVLEPLVRRDIRQPALVTPEFSHDEVDFTDLEESDSPKIQALLALTEIEFDKATGKLSDEDYVALKTEYSAAALAAMEVEDVVGEGEAGAQEDAAEAAVKRARARSTAACLACGPRPELSAVFCSSCGRPLAAPHGRPRCSMCGEALEPQSKFCPKCGGEIAA